MGRTPFTVLSPITEYLHHDLVSPCMSMYTHTQKKKKKKIKNVHSSNILNSNKLNKETETTKICNTMDKLQYRNKKNIL